MKWNLLLATIQITHIYKNKLFKYILRNTETEIQLNYMFISWNLDFRGLISLSNWRKSYFVVFVF